MNKTCPYCAELILDQAVKCKHCGEFLNKKDSLPDLPDQARRVVTSEDSFITRNRGCGDIVIYAPLLLIAIWALSECGK